MNVPLSIVMWSKVFLDAATQAVTTNDGFLPDHRAEEVVSEPDRAAEEAEEAEVSAYFMYECIYVCMYAHTVYVCM